MIHVENYNLKELSIETKNCLKNIQAVSDYYDLGIFNYNLSILHQR